MNRVGKKRSRDSKLVEASPSFNSGKTFLLKEKKFKEMRQKLKISNDLKEKYLLDVAHIALLLKYFILPPISQHSFSHMVSLTNSLSLSLCSFTLLLLLLSSCLKIPFSLAFHIHLTSWLFLISLSSFVWVFLFILFILSSIFHRSHRLLSHPQWHALKHSHTRSQAGANKLALTPTQALTLNDFFLQ